MRFLKSLVLGLVIIFTAGAEASGQSANGDNVAATWHFAGSAALANNTNFDNVKKILTLKTSVVFRDLALDRFSAWLSGSLFSATHDGTASLLRPLLDDFLAAESFWALGGGSNGPLSFMVAVRLDDKHAQTWQAALPKLAGSPGADFAGKPPATAGRQWKVAGGQTLWMLRDKDWLLVGRGEDLHHLQMQFLEELSQKGRPGPALKESWLEADLDWARLARWLPDWPHVLKPARTKITFTAPNQSLLMTAQVIYPNPIPWKFDPWRIPTNIINDPMSSLVSFTTGQDIAAYMNADEPLSRLTDNPLAGQFYVWALGLTGMNIQTYGAWPVADATNSIKRIGIEAPAAFNAALKKHGDGEMTWHPERNTLLWSTVSGMPPVSLQVAPERSGQYLMAFIFPLLPANKQPPPELYQQFLAHTNLVYYDWEGTGRRLEEWRLLSGLLPRASANSIGPSAGVSTNDPVARQPNQIPLTVEENWLTGLTPMLMADNTVTLITRTSPTELKVVRQSPFTVTSLELVLLSHWLSGTGSPGINRNLLPPAAKVTGPGIKPPSP